MMPRRRTILTMILLAFTLSTTAQVRLPRLVRDSMVLQRDVPIRLWGWAQSGEKLTIRFNSKTYKATADNQGKWQATLPAMKAGGPYTMSIDASNHLTLKDILVGDVWICSGQSNMVHQMVLHRERYQADIDKAAYSDIRQFWIPTATELQGPRDDLPGGYWKAATPQDVLQFSAVAYFFARQLYDKYRVPIGLINASVGGTPIQAWTSEEGLKAFPNIAAAITKNKDINTLEPIVPAAPPKRQDKGLTENPAWFSPDYHPAGWRSINVPGYWEDQGIRDLDGVVWYRREIDVPASMANRPATIALGRIVDADLVYLNGKPVGNTTYQYPQRRYQLAAGSLLQGKNILIVRVTNNSGKGGFVPDKPYCIAAGGDTLDLKGTWQYKVGEVFVPQRFTGGGFSAQNSPTALYNAMLAPVVPYRIKGFLWYQGESNTGNAAEYEALMPALITDWRKKWSQGDLPFLYVQLPNFMESQYLPSESQWAATREAQRHALRLPNTGMAVTLGLGEWNDIHPDRKKEVGERLALLAQQIAYGDKSIVSSGPMYETAIADGNRVTISFNHTGSGLVSWDGDELSEFALAGADKKFVWAKARIEGEKVMLSADGVTHPAFVRYAWSDNPVNPNLYNREGLPASPFEAAIGSAGVSGGPWQNKKCAVVLTYDDGLNVHLSKVIPALDSFGLKGTFYISDYFNGLSAQIPGWKRAALSGHELANHTVYHPCAGGPGREFVTPDYDLNNYTMRRMTDEIRTMNNLLRAIDGKTRRTFAYPCGDRKIHDSAYIDPVKSEFVAARGVQYEILPPEKIDLYNVGAYTVNGQSGEALIAQVKQAMEKNGLLVFLFHGVGGEHALNVSLEAHRKLLEFLKQNENDIWVATMVDAAEFIRSRQTK